MLPGKKIVLLFWTKYVVPRQIRPRIVKLNIRNCQRTFNIVFVCVCCSEKDYYSVVLVGQVGFDCRSPCRRNCGMQGGFCQFDFFFFAWIESQAQQRATSNQWQSVTSGRGLWRRNCRKGFREKQINRWFSSRGAFPHEIVIRQQIGLWHHNWHLWGFAVGGKCLIRT